MYNYQKQLEITSNWIKKSFHDNSGGSAAHYSTLFGWSKPYPETTGYLITTLIDLYKYSNDSSFLELAIQAGNWLKKIQNEDGSFPGGLKSKGNINPPSIFNSGQIIDGLTELNHISEDDCWIDVCEKTTNWLVESLDDKGFWNIGNYKPNFNPSYYSQVAWPMLKVYEINNSTKIREAAQKVLKRISKKILKNGSIDDWGFEQKSPAFTHTIAYTIRGFIESAIILDDWDSFGKPIEKSINKLYRQSELNKGKLPGSYDNKWRSNKSFSCLTGNVQVAICFLRFEEIFPDLRLVNASSKLVDFVCNEQNKLKGYKHGAVAGSSPIWGEYMRFRYPNWAAKYHADALLLLINRLEKEKNV